MNQFLSNNWPDKPINVGELYFIRQSFEQVLASERAEDRREWIKEIAACVVLVAGLGLVAIVYLAC